MPNQPGSVSICKNFQVSYQSQIILLDSLKGSGEWSDGYDVILPGGQNCLCWCIGPFNHCHGQRVEGRGSNRSDVVWLIRRSTQLHPQGLEADEGGSVYFARLCVHFLSLVPPHSLLLCVIPFSCQALLTDGPSLDPYLRLSPVPLLS